MTVLSEYRLRQEIIRVTRIVANQGLIRSSDAFPRWYNDTTQPNATAGQISMDK